MSILRVPPAGRALAALLALLALVALAAAGRAQQGGAPSRDDPVVHADDGSAAAARTRIAVAGGMTAELFAAEPHCANLVAIDLTPDGRCFVVETFRRDKQVLDMRDWPQWVEDDLAARTVDDRVAWVTRRAPDLALFRRQSERLRLLHDRDRDGRVDASTPFAAGFDTIADGVAAGVLARGGEVWFANMPNLWRLRDRDGDGVAEERVVHSTGYGVHYAFVGHDLHGLRVGPDGRLYFSCGDRGLNVVTAEGNRLELPDAGAVLRCELDGSGLELFHVGLRNPQELCFDERGDLFTVDNNSDGGDRARLVHVVEGGDSGWRLGWQWVGTPTPRGPWNDEGMWKPAHDGQPQWIHPCVENLVNGPSGLTRDPGGLLPDEFAGAFLVCDFEGQWDNTRVVAFRTAPRGAGHELVFEKALVERGIVATDCDFGADGSLYVSDWVGGWEQTGRGRIWRLSDPAVRGGAAAREVESLLRLGFAGRGDGALAQLLSHRDARVRLEAQLALAARDAVDPLRQVSRLASVPQARRHATWGLSQIARRGGKAAGTATAALMALLGDADGELRAQAAKGLGEARATQAVAPLIAQLFDAEPRARYFAALALADLGDARAVEPLAALAEFAGSNGAADRTLRHAAVSGLSACADDAALATLANHRSRAVRLATLLALRRRGSAALDRFLADPDRALVVEAARAIHDLPLAEHLPALARLLDDPAAKELPLLQRAVNAAFRVGGSEQAQRLARAAALRDDLPAAIRGEALRALAEFDAPPARDRLLGLWRPCAPGRAPEAAAALRDHVDALLRSERAGLAEPAARFVERLRLAGSEEALATLARNEKARSGARLAALDALSAVGAKQLRAAVEATLAAKDDRVRGGARKHLARFDPQQALVILIKALERGSVQEQQDAYAILGEMADPRAAELLALEMGELLEGRVPAPAQLDLLLAAGGKKDDALLAAQLAKHAATKPAGDKIAAVAECATGGDPRRGRELFFHRAELQCVKCHKVGKEGAGEAGPDLAGIGLLRTPEQLLASIVAPNRELSPGYSSTTLILVDDRVLDGRIVGETAATFHLATVDAGLLEVRKSGVKARRQGLSAMPEGLTEKLSPRELRDLVAFVAAQK